MVDTVEKLGFKAVPKFLGILSRGRRAIRNHFHASMSRLSEGSCVSRYPFVSTIHNGGAKSNHRHAEFRFRFFKDYQIVDDAEA